MAGREGPAQKAAGSLCALAMLAAAPAHAAEPAAPEVEFNPAFLRNGSQIDVSRFSRGNSVLPGEYLLDLQINGKWTSRESVRFISQPGSDIAQPCLDRAIVDQIRLNRNKLSPSAIASLPETGSAECIDLAALVQDATVTFDMSQLRLAIE